MNKAFTILSLFILSIGTLHFSGSAQSQVVPASPQTATPEDPIFPGTGIITGRHAEDGRISTSNLSVFGPGICADYGDPYSPLNSPYAPGLYTYLFRIRIPADYPANVVRIELFDPDSINQATNNLTIARSNLAINSGLSPADSKTCGVDGGIANQQDPCLLSTDELDLVSDPFNLDLDQVNPYWFVRIDENRGVAPPPGNGTCGRPGSYDPDFNTTTQYALVYYHQTSNGPEKITLASYIGQTGDGVRDNGEHNTDLRWVSPGAAVPFSNVDAPGNAVPAFAGTIDSFEINLTTDVPNIITDSLTGDRYLYLEVTTLSGASENGYEIWAGPPDYVNSVPSEVNARNLFILNNPGSHDARGVEITAVNSLVHNSNINDPVDIPLAYIGPELAGHTFDVRLFDSDTGAQAPIIFYFDNIAFTPDASNPLGYDPALTDWAAAFAVAGQDDPDGIAEGVRCIPGFCASQWVDPAYQITIPGTLGSCDWQNQTPESCTPFHGGRLMVRYDGGLADTYTWEISSTTGDPIEQTAGCAAFPITIHEGIRSVTAPGTGSNPYPNPGDFTYPPSPPAYSSFLDHQADIPLLNATPGTIYRVQNGFGSGNFGWLVWNSGIVPNSATLANSLTWPGDTLDYTDHGDGGTAVSGSGFAHVVRGYIEPGDPTDQALNIGDWVAATTGSINSADVQTQLRAAIDLGYTLRLPIWNNTANGQYQTAQFAIFRLVGYSLSQSGPWLLLEFIDFDTSCGQQPVAPASVSIAGPTTGETGTSYSFTAAVSPGTTTTPITYAWEITGHDTITNTDNINNSITLAWSGGGSKMIVVTAVNSSGLSASQTHTIEITSPGQQLYLPVINKAATDLE